MSYKIVSDLINKGKIPACNLLFGTEDFLIDKLVQSLKLKYIDENYQDMNYIEFDKIEDDFESFYEFISTFPFMSDKKLCVVKEAEFLTSTKSLNKAEEDKIINFIENKYDSCLLIFLIKGKKADSRKKIVKMFKDSKSLFEINKLSEGELSKYIQDNFKENSIEISLMDADYIANNSGYLEYESAISLYEVNNEIHKLVSYCMNTRKVKREDIDNLMIKSIESNIFKLVDYICEGQKEKALEILEEMLLNNTPEQYIIHMIIRQYRMLYQFILLSSKGYSMDDIMDKMKIKKFVGSKLSKLSKHLSLNIIDNYMEHFLQIDKKIKTGEIDKKIGLEIITNGIA